MLNYKIYLPVALLLLALTACNPLKKATGFTEDNNIAAALFANVEGADSVWVYRTKFVTKFVENRNALEFTLLNEEQLGKAIKYIGVDGQAQDVYLFRLVQKGRPGTFMYCSARYMMAPAKTAEGYDTSILKCIGFGPAYKGRYGKAKQAIYFDELWKIAKADDTYRLQYLKKTNLIFVLQNTVSSRRDEPINISRVALDEHNKIAGSRPVVFPVPSLFGMESLEFKYLTTIKLE